MSDEKTYVERYREYPANFELLAIELLEKILEQLEDHEGWFKCIDASIESVDAGVRDR